MQTESRMVRLPLELVERVDGARGQVPRERWVRRMLEDLLDRLEGGAGEASRAESAASAAGSPEGGSSTRAGLAAPPLPRRPNVGPKRAVAPIPKGKK